MAPRRPLRVRELPRGFVVLPGARLVVGREGPGRLVLWALQGDRLVRTHTLAPSEGTRRSP